MPDPTLPEPPAPDLQPNVGLLNVPWIRKALWWLFSAILGGALVGGGQLVQRTWDTSAYIESQKRQLKAEILAEVKAELTHYVPTERYLTDQKSAEKGIDSINSGLKEILEKLR